MICIVTALLKKILDVNTKLFTIETKIVFLKI